MIDGKDLLLAMRGLTELPPCPKCGQPSDPEEAGMWYCEDCDWCFNVGGVPDDKA